MAEAPNESEKSDKQEKAVAAAPDVEYSEKIMKVPPVHSSDEIYRYVDLGLGRGLDGTDPTPWLNKSSFQVRRITYENILGTEEGGAVQSYEREISSVQTQQTKIKTSILVPKSPLTIGTDAELSRSVHASRRAIGRKVINRTISFRDNFDDLPFGDAALPVVQDDGSRDGNYQNLWTFEQRLAQWIMDKLRHEWSEAGRTGALDDGETKPTLESSDVVKCPLKDLLRVIERNDREDLRLIKEACKEFVNHFRITHYVSAIELGAAEYRVFTEDEYQTAISVAGSFGIDKLASTVTRQEFSFKRKRKASDLKKIGIIGKDDRVVRGSYGEAVVNVSINSIATLVRTKYLHDQMDKALVKFVELQSDRSDGPFLISSGSGLYLRVTDTYAVVGTRNRQEASEFHIIPNDGTVKANEFLIGYYKDINEPIIRQRHERHHSIVSEANQTSKVMMYLNAPLTLLGRNSGPLHVQDTVSDSTCRFVLHSRVISQKKNQLPIPLSSWTSGGDMFFINCSRRSYRRDGYLSISRRPGGRNRPETYDTTCTSSTRHHDGRNVFMLFQLLPNALPELSDDETEGRVGDPVPKATPISYSHDEGFEMKEQNL